ncbi:MAG: histidine kinase [Bacteroidota bacterium]
MNKSDYRIIGGYLFTVTCWLIYIFNVVEYSLQEYLIDIPAALVQIVLLLVISKWLIEYYFVKGGNLIVFLTLTLLSFWLVGFLTMLSGDFSRTGSIPWNQYVPVGEIIISNVNNSIYNLALPLSLLSGKKYYEHQLNTLSLVNAKKELELKILRSQFDPHFLYNSLNTIDALVDYSSKQKVKEYVTNLASLYRNLVQFKDEELVPLEDEMALGKNYLFLIQTSFENDYDFQFQFQEVPAGMYLPNRAFLSALENVVKHNKPIPNQPVEVSIQITPDQMIITNTKHSTPSQGEISEGTGLASLNEQYLLLSNTAITVVDKPNRFALHLPLLSVLNKRTG